jgi:hypothetical protein
MKKNLPKLRGSKKTILLLIAVLFFHNFVFSQTRLYLNLNTAAAVSPAFNTGWNVTSGAARFQMNTDRDGSTIASKTTGNSGGSAVKKCLLDQWVSEPLDAQTITGTFTGQIRFQQSTTTSVTGQGFVYLRVINSNGTIATEVGTATTSNLTTTLTNRTLISLNVGTLNITAGQRIAVDVGWNYSAGTNNAVNCIISRGSSSGTDLPANNTTTTANSPWVQFSDDLVFLPPTNDDCIGAVSLTPGAACVNTGGTLKYATPDAATPLGCFTAGTYYDVWYKFVATTYTHTVTLSTLGTNFTAPRIQIYSGGCGALVSEGCASGTSFTQANLTPGTTYYVRIANYNADPSGIGTVADFNICVTNNPPPATDACAGSVLLTSALACTNVTGNLQYAASNGPAGACGGATATTTYDVWYRFVANSTTHAITLSSLGSNLTAATTYIETFSSSGSCAGLTSLDCQNASSVAVVGGLTVGATYYVRIYVITAPNNATTANWNFNICIQQPPANDECTGAVNLTSGASCVNTAGTLNVATANGATPQGCFAAGTYYDVWYKFTATTFTHTVTLSSLGANVTASRIQIYSGTCGALVSEGCATGTTLTQAGLTPGAVYYVRVANYNADPSGAAGFNICVTGNPPPANDACAGSVLLTSNIACSNTTGNLQYATSSAPSGTCGGATATTTYDVWYKFVANSTTHYITLSNLGSNLTAATTYIEIFNGTCGSLTSLDCQDASTVEVLSGLTIGSTYYVRVYVTSPPNNATTANWNFSICIQQPPANDECTGAVNLTPGTTCANTAGTINLATENATTPLGCFAAGTYYDVWYKFTATTTIETITLSSLGANFTAPRIQLYSGTCGSLVSIACASGTSLLQYGLTAGATYYVRIANYNVNPLVSANFNICITYITPPANDECTGAVTLTSGTSCTTTSGTLLNSSPNSSVLPACGNSGSAEVWYKFIANSNRPVITLSSLGSNLNAASPYIQLFSGFCGSLTSLACSPSPLNTAVTPGGVGLTINSTYYIRVTTNTNTSVPTSGNWGFNICVTDPAGAAVDFAKTYVNITDGTAGGTIDPGDILEIRSILVVQRPGSSTANVAIDSVAFYDTLSANKGFRLLKDSMALKTNEGKLFRPTNNSYFTDLSTDADAAWITTAGAGSDTALQINMGTGATRTARGKITYTSRPSNFGSTCIIMATYRVRVTAAYGTKIEYGGGAFRYRDSTTGTFYTINFPADSLIVYTSPGACPDAVSATNVVGDEYGGTFGAPTGSPVYPQNRSTSANTNYAYATFGGGNGPGDYYYGVANNTSGNASTVQTLPKPTATSRVFSVWDISGDHTGAANSGTTSKGNPPCNINAPISPTNPCGYMLVVNSAYRADVAFEYNFSGACTETYYEISAWVKNICSKCGCDSLGTGSTNAGYQATGPGDSSGIRPNLAFQINGIDYYTTGDIVHQGVVGTQTGSDTLNRWVKRSFVYKTQPGETSFNMTFRNNAPGGGGNDWAVDDISIRTCYPNMTYSPSVTPYACANNSITITDTVRSYYNTYVLYKWQRSTNGGTTWVDIAGTTGTATPVVVNGMYEFVTAYTVPAAFTTPANNGDQYRVVVATNIGNLASNGCNFTDAIPITISITQPSSGPTSVTGTDFCYPGSTTLTAIGGTLGTSANYQWGTGSVVGTSPIIGATGSTLTVSPATTTTYWVRIENTNSPCPAITSGLTKTITVSQSSAAPTSITGVNICSGSSTTLTALGGTLGTSANYQWGTGSVVGTSPIVGATGSTLTVSPASTTTYWVRIENTLSPCTPTTGGVTKTITVTQASAAPTSITAPSTTFCNTGTVTLTAAGGILGSGANYQWGTGAVVGVNPIAGATGPTYAVVGLTSTTTYWVRIENTAAPCTSTTGGTTATITINTPSVAPASITGTDFCNPGSTILTANGGSLGTGANYQWGTGSVVGTAPIAGATNSTLTVSPTTTTTYWVRIQNTSAPCTANTGGVTKVVTVFQPSTGPASISAPSTTFCNTGTVTLTAVGGVLGTSANYQWGTGSVIGVNPIAGATGPTYAVVGLTSTATYWVRIENTASPCTSATGGATTTITINTPSVAPGSITGTGYCNPGSTILTANGGTLGTGANYQWGTGAVVGTNPIAGATGATLTISPTATTTYWVRIENTTAPCTANTGGTTKVITVTQPSVAPTLISSPSTTFCGSGSVILTAVGGTLGSGANYQWGTGAVVGVNPIAGATGPTYSVVALTSTTTYWVRIENTTAPCTSTTGGATTVITINTASIAPSGITGTGYCNPGTTTLTATGGTLGTGAYYQWGTGAVVGTNPIGGANSSTLTISPTSTTTYWVRIENTAAPCTSNTGGVTKVITVSQPSVAAVSATKNRNNGICPGIPVQLGITGGSLGTNANWKWYTGSCTGTLVGTGATITVTPSVNTTYYVRAEGDCNVTACVSVTVTISCDIDKDKDGIPDWVESNMAAAFAGSPIINAYNPAYSGYVDNNNDYINDNFQADGDSDNDGTPNYLDTDFPGRVDSNGDGVDDRFDADLDGRINMLDLDSDNDGIPDVVEAYGVDTNGDGLIDNFSDTDGDGLSQNVDVNNTGASNTGAGLGRIDFDGDGYPNFLDLDSDNDGIPDLVEAGGTDINNNGKVDVFTDANNNGWSDGFEGMSNALLRTGADGNNDGRADTFPYKNMDGDAKPNPYDVDSDGDGIVDVVEAGLPDANLNGIVDGTIGTNGWSTTISGMGTFIPLNSDGDIYPDYLDIDADNDGITDNVEGQTTLGYKVPTTADADGDGLATIYDQTVGFGGGGIYPVDTDLDGIPDYLDLDSDADGQIDRIEGNDFNFNKLPDDLVTLTGIDTDHDGLDDRFDNDNTSPKVTSAYMGNSGSLSGPTPPGTRSVVQRSWPTQSDRDWRYVGNVLLVDILKFSGVPQGDKVLLNWTIVADKEIDRFEIERSTDNSNYIKAGTVKEPVTMQVQQNFGYTDDVSAVTSDIIYYRLKVIGKAGEIKYSNVLVIRRTQTRTPVKIMPNPANNYVSIRFFAEKDGEVTIRMIDNIGKLIFIEKQKVIRGNNTVQLNDLSKYSSGVYTLQIFINDDVVTEKLVLTR